MSSGTEDRNTVTGWLKYLLTLGISEQVHADRKIEKMQEEYRSSSAELEKLLGNTFKKGFGKNHDGLAN